MATVLLEGITFWILLGSDEDFHRCCCWNHSDNLVFCMVLILKASPRLDRVVHVAVADVDVARVAERPKVGARIRQLRAPISRRENMPQQNNCGIYKVFLPTNVQATRPTGRCSTTRATKRRKCKNSHQRILAFGLGFSFGIKGWPRL